RPGPAPLRDCDAGSDAPINLVSLNVVVQRAERQPIARGWGDEVRPFEHELARGSFDVGGTCRIERVPGVRGVRSHVPVAGRFGGVSNVSKIAPPLVPTDFAADGI